MIISPILKFLFMSNNVLTYVFLLMVVFGLVYLFFKR